MLNFAALLRANVDKFGSIAALESGAPVSSPGIGMATAHVDYSAGWIDKFEAMKSTIDPDMPPPAYHGGQGKIIPANLSLRYTPVNYDPVQDKILTAA